MRRSSFLDEAPPVWTTNLKRRFSALNNLLESRTSLVIAHRLSTIHDADQIVVLENGQVVERRALMSLLKADGAYKTV